MADRARILTHVMQLPVNVVKLHPVLILITSLRRSVNEDLTSSHATPTRKRLFARNFNTFLILAAPMTLLIPITLILLIAAPTEQK